MHGNLEDIVWTPWLSMMVWWLDDVDNYNDGDFYQDLVASMTRMVMVLLMMLVLNTVDKDKMLFIAKMTRIVLVVW